MPSSTFPNVLPFAVIKRYPASAAVAANTFVDHDGADGTVSTATSGEGYGISTNSAAIGEDVDVVVFGPAYLKFAGTVAAGGSIVATTAGAGLAAGTEVASRVLCTPDSKAGAGYVSGNLGFVIVGNLYTTPA